MFGKNKGFKCPEENRICGYCENATLLGNSDVCICQSKGPVKTDGVCRKFRFDFLKLNPHTLKLVDAKEGAILFTD